MQTKKEHTIMGLKEEDDEINYSEVWMGLKYKRSLYVKYMGITMSDHTGIN